MSDGSPYPFATAAFVSFLLAMIAVGAIVPRLKLAQARELHHPERQR